MPVILVVDDSVIDQRLVTELLKRKKNWDIEVADDGEIALEMLEKVSPQVVITDLRMPNMDGMALVGHIKSKYPLIPVVLMTSKGSETLAVEALKKGAASYVPKSALREYLIDTVEQVLRMADLAYARERLRSCMKNSQFEFQLTNEPGLIYPLVGFVNEYLTRQSLGDASFRRHACIALQEALVNAMLHGNLELSRDQAQDARQAMHAREVNPRVEERNSEQPFCNQRTRVIIDIDPPKVQFIVQDDGKGFDVTQLPSVDELDNISTPVIGRGLTLIGQLMDEVEFNELGNQIRMTLFDPGYNEDAAVTGTSAVHL